MPSRHENAAGHRFPACFAQVPGTGRLPDPGKPEDDRRANREATLRWVPVADRITDGLKLRRLLLLGYAGIFVVWLGSAWALTDRMAAADLRSAEIRTQFLHNDQLLSTVRAQVLLSSVYLRDALLDTEPTDSYI